MGVAMLLLHLLLRWLLLLASAQLSPEPTSLDLNVVESSRAHVILHLELPVVFLNFILSSFFRGSAVFHLSPFQRVEVREVLST